MKNRIALLAVAFVALVAALIYQQLGFAAAALTFIVGDIALTPLAPKRPGHLFANSLGTLSTGLILTEALSQAIAFRPALSKVSHDFSDQPAKLNDVVRTRIIGSPTVNDFGTGASDRTDTDVSVTMSGFKEVFHTFTGNEINASSRDIVRESAAPLAEKIADHWMGLLGALWASTSFTSVVKASASFAYATLTDARETLNAASASKMGRFGVVNSAVYKALLQDSLCNRSSRGDGADPTADGELRAIAGFENIYEFPSLPSTNNTNGFFGTKETTAIVVRPAENLREMYPNIAADGNMGYVSIPDPNDPSKPGLTVLAVEKINVTSLSVSIAMFWLQGAAVARTAHGSRYKTA